MPDRMPRKTYNLRSAKKKKKKKQNARILKKTSHILFKNTTRQRESIGKSYRRTDHEQTKPQRYQWTEC